MTEGRATGFNERRCISRENLGLYGWIAVTGKYKLNHQKSTWQSQLFNAVKHCLSNHPALSAVVQSTSKPLRIAQLPQVDIHKHIQVLTSQHRTAEDGLDGLLTEAHRHKSIHDGTDPQWRLFVLPVVESGSRLSFQIAFAYSHVMMDGMSGYKFHATLLEGLNSLSTAVEQDPIWRRDASQAKLPPALDQATTLPISWSFLLRPLLGEFLPERLTKLLGISKEVGVWHGAEARPPLPVSHELIKTSIHLSSLSSLELDQALQLCRRHQCKLTSLINFVFAQCLSEGLSVRGKTFRKFTAEVPYDLRRGIAGSINSMANYASAVEISFDTSIQADQTDEGSMWQTIKSQGELIQRSASSLSDQPVALLKYLSDFDEWVTRRASQPSEISFSTSNIGNFATPSTSKGEWAVQEMVFSQSGDATGAPINVNLASAQSGRLWIVLTWWPGMLGVDDESIFLQDVCDRSVSRIRRLIT